MHHLIRSHIHSIIVIFLLMVTYNSHLSSAQDINNHNQPIISLQNQGDIQGYFSDQLAIFKGIPYAAPPIHEYRWLPPQPNQGWEGIKQTTHYGANCSQALHSWDSDPTLKNISEDCLYLNIWAPKDYFTSPDQHNNYPVMVWIHGGAFVSGGSSLSIYDGSELAKQGVILVSFNYRLGRFGFFAHPTLKQENEESQWANYGILDQIAALQWIKNNIASFGGDSNNISVFGESAGGASILTLMTLAEAKGLFNKAIIQSGTGHSRSFPFTPLEQAEEISSNFAKKYNITENNDQTLKQLRSLSEDQIVDGLNIQNLQSDLFPGIIIDQTLIQHSLDDSFKNNQFYPVPLLIGDTNGDGLILSKTTLSSLASGLKTTPEILNSVYNKSGVNSDRKVISQIVGDTQILEPTRNVAQQISKKQIPVYRYRFSYVTTSARSYTSFGAPHASELPYVFNSLKKSYGTIAPQDEAMAQAVMAYWISFAKTGKPNPQGFPEISTINDQPDKLLNFTMDGIQYETDPIKYRLDFIEKLILDHSKTAKDTPSQSHETKYPTR